MAVNDIVNDSFDLTYSDVIKIDDFFRQNNCMTLSQARKDFMGKYKKIITNNKIKNEQEFYLVRGIADSPDINLTEEEKNHLISMIEEYEFLGAKK